MKTAILNKLTSSKNERIAFDVIYCQTIEQGLTSKLILNNDFYDAGISNRKALNLAINRLKDKGLIFKRIELLHRYDFDAYRFQVDLKGCSLFFLLR